MTLWYGIKCATDYYLCNGVLTPILKPYVLIFCLNGTVSFVMLVRLYCRCGSAKTSTAPNFFAIETPAYKAALVLCLYVSLALNVVVKSALGTLPLYQLYAFTIKPAVAPTFNFLPV